VRVSCHTSSRASNDSSDVMVQYMGELNPFIFFAFGFTLVLYDSLSLREEISFFSFFARA